MIPGCTCAETLACEDPGIFEEKQMTRNETVPTKPPVARVSEAHAPDCMMLLVHMAMRTFATWPQFMITPADRSKHLRRSVTWQALRRNLPLTHSCYLYPLAATFRRRLEGLGLYPTKWCYQAHVVKGYTFVWPLVHEKQLRLPHDPEKG